MQLQTCRIASLIPVLSLLFYLDKFNYLQSLSNADEIDLLSHLVIEGATADILSISESCFMADKVPILCQAGGKYFFAPFIGYNLVY